MVTISSRCNEARGGTNFSKRPNVNIPMSKTAKKGKKAPRIKTPRVRMKIEDRIDVKHEFNGDEKIALGERLTSTMTTHSNVTDQKKTMAKEYDSKLKILQMEIDGIHGRLRDGHEYRPTDVIIFFNKGLKAGKAVKMKGYKLITRKDNGAIVRDEPMSPGDFQDELIEVQRAEKTIEANHTKTASETREEEILNSPRVPEAGGVASTAATA